MSATLVPLPPLLAVPPQRLHDVEVGARLEWFEPDGKGGYAAGTAVNANTRRDHAIVVVPGPAGGRCTVLLSRLEETVELNDGTRHDLGVAFYPGAVHPAGHALLASFSLDPWPTWRYRLGSAELVKELFVSRRVAATVIRYRIRGGPAVIEVRPLVPDRAGDALTRAHAEIREDAEASERLVAYQPHDDAPPVVLSFAAGSWRPQPDWYYSAVYPCDVERGIEAQEDLFCPGVLLLPLDDEEPTTLTCGLRPARIAHVSQWTADELCRRGRAAEGGRLAAHDDDRLGELGARLGLAADAFLVDSPAGRTLLTGCPPAGTDAAAVAAAIPGLLVTTGRLADAAAVLRSLVRTLRPLTGSAADPERTSTPQPAPTGALWFAEAAARLADAGGDASQFMPFIGDLLDACIDGVSAGLRVDEDGLVSSVSEAGLPAARTVAANALWYNALMRAATLIRDSARVARYSGLAARCRTGFDAFWFADGGYLYDRLDAAGRGDPACRPDQLLAVSLAHSPLDAQRARKVVDTVDRELVVPQGVRTLSPHGRGYDPRAEQRGQATPRYLGQFAAAYVRVYGADAHTRERLRRMSTAFEPHLAEHGLGHVSEHLTGDAPNRAGGSPADARSCAAVLEMLRLATVSRVAVPGTGR